MTHTHARTHTHTLAHMYRARGIMCTLTHVPIRVITIIHTSYTLTHHTLTHHMHAHAPPPLMGNPVCISLNLVTFGSVTWCIVYLIL